MTGRVNFIEFSEFGIQIGIGIGIEVGMTFTRVKNSGEACVFCITKKGTVNDRQGK